MNSGRYGTLLGRLVLAACLAITLGTTVRWIKTAVETPGLHRAPAHFSAPETLTPPKLEHSALA